MIKLLALFLALGASQAQLEVPNSPTDYSAAFFLIDLTGVSSADRTKWLDPGDTWCLVKDHSKCAVGATHTPQELTDALTDWAALSSCEQWALRLYHTSEIRKAQNNGQKRYVVFTTSIPVRVRASVVSCSNTGETAYIGDTYAIACAYLDNLIPNYCDKFYNNKQFETIISGWEHIFNVERPCKNFNRLQNRCVARY